jgi:hypothetical protein
LDEFPPMSENCWIAVNVAAPAQATGEPLSVMFWFTPGMRIADPANPPAHSRTRAEAGDTAPMTVGVVPPRNERLPEMPRHTNAHFSGNGFVLTSCTQRDQRSQ